MEPWPMIEADREALSQCLSTLSADDWRQPSLCRGWRNEDVADHYLAGLDHLDDVAAERHG